MDQGRLEAKGLTKLHLGCGAKRLEGYVNVDKYGDAADQRVDLEAFPWPWETSSVGEVVLIHVLEHLGGDPETFRGIIQEIYRVCAPGAVVKIVVPHPRHDNFIGDPTHVRPITPQLLTLFDAELCRQWQAAGYSNTPLALYWGVNFRIARHASVLDEPYNTMLVEQQVTKREIDQMARELNNVIAEIHVELEAVK